MARKPDPYAKYRNRDLYPELRLGATGAAVKIVQQILQSQGFFQGAVRGNFLELTKAAVVHFQQSHIDAEGKSLSPDGVVGLKTWWALENASGAAQRNFLAPPSDDKLVALPEYRQRLLRVIDQEHKAGVREIPDGSNWGDGVTKYLKGIGPAPWCMYAGSWIYREATGDWPLGKQFGHVQTFTKALKKAGCFFEVDSDYVPIPGDFFLMHYPGTTGHVGFVIATAANAPAQTHKFNTAEGNAGNRFKYGTRARNQGTLVGFGNLFQDAGLKFRRGLVSASGVGSGTQLGDDESTR